MSDQLEVVPSPRGLRILHVIRSMSPRDGGPPEGLRQLVPNYRALGDQVEILTLDGPAEPYLQELPCPVHAVGLARVHYGASRRLTRWLRANIHRFDLAVINGVWLFHGLAVWRAARRAGVPYLVFTHGALDVYFKRRYPLKHLKKVAYWPLEYQVLRRARAVLFTSEVERELSAASFRPNGWKSCVVPYGTSRPEGDSRSMLRAFHERVPELAGERYLLFLARIHEKKGCDLLLEAFAAIAARDRELRLVMAGPDYGGLQARLEQQALELGIADRVHWPGMLSGAAKYGALLAAEAFVLPSHQENFGIAVAEALAMGTPVLISDQVNVCREIVADQVGLVAPDTLEGTRELLEGWLALPESERAAMSHRAVATFERRYSLRETAQAIHALAS